MTALHPLTGAAVAPLQFVHTQFCRKLDASCHVSILHQYVLIWYYFTSKEELLEQVVTEIYRAAIEAVTPQIMAQPTTALRLHAYIRSAVDYIGATACGWSRSWRSRSTSALRTASFGTAEPRKSGFWPLWKRLLRQGQEEGDFRPFDVRVMAVTIRRAIDALPSLFTSVPDLDVESYGQELVTLFDRATRKE